MVQWGGFIGLFNPLSSIMNSYAKELKNMDPKEFKNKSAGYVFEFINLVPLILVDLLKKSRLQC